MGGVLKTHTSCNLADGAVRLLQKLLCCIQTALQQVLLGRQTHPLPEPAAKIGGVQMQEIGKLLIGQREGQVLLDI